MRQFLAGGLLSCLAFAAPAEVLPLAQLLDGVSDSASVRAAMADITALDALRERREAEAGWQWYASGGAGHYRELVTDELRNDYTGSSVAIGIRHPLLGSLRRQLSAVTAVASERTQQQAMQQLASAEQRLALSSAYADWWRASETAKWCSSLDGRTERARHEIAERAQSGWLLTSEARLLEARWNAVTAECVAADGALATSRDMMERLSQRSLEGVEPVAEPLPLNTQPLETWQARLDLHPRVQARQEQLRLADSERQAPWYSSIDSSFSVAQGFESRQGASQPGNALVASLNFSAPFDPMSYGKAGDRERAARQLAAQERLEAERGLLIQALGRSLAEQQRASLSLSPARERFDIAKLALREQKLRRAADVEQDFGRLQMSELELHRAALDLVDSWYTSWQQMSGLRLLVTDDAQRSALMGGDMARWAPLDANTTEPKASKPWKRGVYMWDSRALLDPATQLIELSRLESVGIKRIYIGLSAEQLAQPDVVGKLDALAITLRMRGSQPVLLLGDPDWMLSEHRASLIAIISKLKPVSFTALHLDLEVEQRGWPVPAQHVRDWLDTLKQAAAASPWPIEISSHYRWFTEEMGGVPCAPCELPSLGISDVSLMIYTRSAERSAQLTEQIARRWPAIHFRLAQSVEPQLAPEETWAGASQALLQEQDDHWQAKLQPFAVGGVDWQAWKHYPTEQQP